MANTTADEKDILDWFDGLDRSSKWRVAYYLIEGECPAAETLSFLKAIDEQGPVGMRSAHAKPGNLH